MAHEFDPGYGREPYLTLCREYPGADIYPFKDFRTEWGPIFHRGRLDGSARVLVIGQDPAQHETILRRILVGTAGQRAQGFLFKLGIERSYLMINTFLYSVYGQFGGTRHAKDAAIADYRHRWLNAIFSDNPIEAVVALGSLADTAWQTWRATPESAAWNPPFAHITHPTQPESSSGNDKAKYKQALAAMLDNWNGALAALKPAIQHPDTPRDLVPYGDDFKPEEVVDIPETDLPAGLPVWMLGGHAWAARKGGTAAVKRATIVVTVPPGVIPT